MSREFHSSDPDQIKQVHRAILAIERQGTPEPGKRYGPRHGNWPADVPCTPGVRSLHRINDRCPPDIRAVVEPIWGFEGNGIAGLADELTTMWLDPTIQSKITKLSPPATPNDTCS